MAVLRAEIEFALAGLYPSGTANYDETTALGQSPHSDNRPTEQFAIARSLGDIGLIPNGKEMMVELMTLERKVRKVEAAIKSLTPRELELVQLRYFKEMDNLEVCEHLGITRSPYYDMRSQVVAKLARCMGFLDVAS